MHRCRHSYRHKYGPVYTRSECMAQRQVEVNSKLQT